MWDNNYFNLVGSDDVCMYVYCIRNGEGKGEDCKEEKNAGICDEFSIASCCEFNICII